MKLLILLTMLLSSYMVMGQDIFFKSGFNVTQFEFEDNNGDKLNTFIAETGSSYHLGVGFPLSRNLLRYELGLSLETYNSTFEDPLHHYSWNTTYGGIKNSLGVNLFVYEFTLAIVANLGFSKILEGTQLINNSTYSLTTNQEFNGLMVQPGLGIAVSYNILNDAFLSFQYDYSKSFRIRNTPEERLSFNINQIIVGVHIQID